MSELKVLKGKQQGMGILIENEGYINPDDRRNKTFVNEVQKIVEGKSIIPDPLKVFVVLQKYGVENRNGRIYPKHILYRENEKYQELIKEKRALGENNHPESSIISLDRVAINITKTWWENATLVGEMEILMSPGFVSQGIISCEGDKVANLLRQGIMIGVSSRGVGSLREIKGQSIVQDDFELICWDVVSSPSTPGAWVFNNKEESKPFMESEIKTKNLLTDKLDKFLLG